MNHVPAGYLARQHARTILHDKDSTITQRDAARQLLGMRPIPCGTRSRYTQGCRCPHCTEANTAYSRSYRGDDRLPVSCWCEHEIVHVPREDILAGLTRTCGKKDCRP